MHEELAQKLTDAIFEADLIAMNEHGRPKVFTAYCVILDVLGAEPPIKQTTLDTPARSG